MKKIAMMLGAAVAASAVSPSWAADGTWIGGTSTDLCEPLNWSDKVLPTDNASIGLASAGTLTCSGTFSPKSITFPSDSALVTIDGAGSITGILAITNLAAANHVFNCEVVCADGITPDITRGENNYMTFAGGITMYNAPKTGGAKTDYWCGKITITTTDAQNYTSSGNKNYIRLDSTGTTFTFDNGCIDHMYLGRGATAVVNRLTYQGCKRSSNNGWFSLVFDIGNGVLRAGEIESTNDAVLFHSYAGADMVGGTIIADKLTCATTKQPGGSFPYPVFMLNCGGIYGAGVVTADGWNGEGVWVIGPGGLAFGETIHERSHFETKIGKSLGGRPAATLHSFADWTLQSSPNGRNAVALNIDSGKSGFLAIDTSHYAIGDARYDSATSHTVTLDGMVDGGGSLRVEGNGKVVFANEYSDFSGGLTVTDTATASVKAGCKPGSGAVTLATGTTLEVAESGTATLVGTLTLGENSNLAFNFTQRDVAPALAGTATTAAGESVNVKVSAADDLRPKGGTYALTSGMDFSGKTVNLVDKPEWAQGASVVNGDIVLVVKPVGLAVFVR